MPRHTNLIPFGVAAVVGVALLAVIGVPIWSYLPFIALFAVCPLAMVFMMRGMVGDCERRPIEQPVGGRARTELDQRGACEAPAVGEAERQPAGSTGTGSRS